MSPVIGVCGWSLEPGSPAEMIERARRAGCRALQIALDPVRTGAWRSDDLRERADAAGIEIVSGMMAMQGEDYTSLDSIARTGGVRPTETWGANRAAARENAEIARSLGLDLVTFHAGHLPADRDDPERTTMIDRLRELVEIYGSRGIRVGLETGQETAETLWEYLEEIPGSGVNFDPANMILYGMGDPHDALERLAPRVVQLHIKDATPTDVPGTWGTEVPAGDGAVDWPRLMRIAHERTPRVPLMIEREAGTERVHDIARAHALISGLVGASL